MKNVRIRNAVSLIMNIALPVLVLLSILWFFSPEALNEGVGNMKIGGTGCFVFFTNDSNILAALCCLVLVPYNIKAIISGKDEIPRGALILKFVGTVGVALTMMVVILFLGPTQGFGKMFAGTCLELHLICPLLAIISFCFFERGHALTKRETLYGIIPTVIYGTVYLLQVVLTKQWEDFYGFNIGGFWYISYIVVPSVSYVFARLIRAMHNRAERVIA